MKPILSFVPILFLLTSCHTMSVHAETTTPTVLIEELPDKPEGILMERAWAETYIIGDYEVSVTECDDAYGECLQADFVSSKLNTLAPFTVRRLINGYEIFGPSSHHAMLVLPYAKLGFDDIAIYVTYIEDRWFVGSDEKLIRNTATRRPH